jgi:N-acetylmuramoyl-L-alanine amidase
MLKKICIHWTAGPYRQTISDYRAYHFTVDGNGEVVAGQFKPTANIPPLRNGAYAAHCGGGNSYCIGVALCGMAGYISPQKPGKYPLKAVQAEAAWAFIAKLCVEHHIAVTPETVFTHYEFGQRHPGSDSDGKIDITHLPYLPTLKAEAVGDYIRGKVTWYLRKIKPLSL